MGVGASHLRESVIVAMLWKLVSASKYYVHNTLRDGIVYFDGGMLIRTAGRCNNLICFWVGLYVIDAVFCWYSFQSLSISYGFSGHHLLAYIKLRCRMIYIILFRLSSSVSVDNCALFSKRLSDLYCYHWVKEAAFCTWWSIHHGTNLLYEIRDE